MNKISIIVSAEFKTQCPHFKGAAILANVHNTPTSPELWKELQTTCADICQRYTIDTVKQRSGIAATRAAYKTFGKDPSRYRPACEQLTRRVLQGKELYSVDTLADIGNLVSIVAGYSTAALDADKIEGNKLTLGVGQAGEPYEGIGRGVLNIDCLPVYRDEIGGVATPTSDNVRTMTSMQTQRLLLLINAYDGDTTNLQASVQHTVELLEKYAQANNLQISYYESTE